MFKYKRNKRRGKREKQIKELDFISGYDLEIFFREQGSYAHTMTKMTLRGKI